MNSKTQITSSGGSHWYTASGIPMHQVQGKTTGEMRDTTLRDARELNLLPSVSKILQVLHKPALVEWKCRQAVLAVMTAPQKKNEALDAYVERVLQIERHHDEESDIAKDLGNDIHMALHDLFSGRSVPSKIYPWVESAFKYLSGKALWRDVQVECVVVGDEYAGTLDWFGRNSITKEILIVDFKSTKSVPKKRSYPEHELQLSAYAEAVEIALTNPVPIKTANLYISTVECGHFMFHENPPWEITFQEGFSPLVQVWQWMNDYRPKTEQRPREVPVNILHPNREW